jgi:predicted permease
MNELVRDLRLAVRLLSRSPGFTVVAILTLALGLGANTTVFSWIRGALVSPLPGVPHQERLRPLVGFSRTGEGRSFSVPDVRDLQKDQQLADVVAYNTLGLSLASGGRPERVWGSLVTGNFFDALQVHPILGRGFLPEEDGAPGAHPVVVLAHHFWQERFHGDRAIVGRTIRLNNRAFTVVGVAPPGFQGAEIGLKMDLWLPLAMQEQVAEGGSRLEARGSHWMQAIVRLRPGVEQPQAQAAIDAIAARLGRTYPDTNDGMHFALFRFWNSPQGAPNILLPVLSVLGAMAALVLLLACANVANLLLVRALGRRKEMAVRMAIGARRARLARQLLTESLLLSLIAGALGIVLSFWGVKMLMAFIPPTDAPVDPVFTLDAPVLAFAVTLSVLTGLVFSLAPVLQTSPAGLAPILRDESAGSGGGRKGKARSALVVAQIALSCVLLVAAGLFLRSLAAGRDLDSGFHTRKALLATLDLFPNGYDEARGRTFFRELLRRTSVLPGVESSTLAMLVPLDFEGSNSTNLTVPGYAPGKNEEMVVCYNLVGPDYFGTLGIPLVAGRDFTFADDERKNVENVVVVNETMAHRYWAGRPIQEVLGQKVKIWGSDLTIVGIAKDGKYQTLGEKPQPFFYLPLLQAYAARVVLHVRTAGDPAQVAGAVRATVRGIDPDLPLTAVRTMEQHLSISVFAQRLAASFLGGFGMLALFLAMIGLYSVVRYAVSQRTRELGVRMALGAQPREVTGMVVREGMILAAAGLGLGAAASVAVGRLLQSQLLGVSATDPAVFLGVAALLALICAAASWLPARAAAAVDPMVVLRSE